MTVHLLFGCHVEIFHLNKDPLVVNLQAMRNRTKDVLCEIFGKALFRHSQVQRQRSHDSQHHMRQTQSKAFYDSSFYKFHPLH